MCVTHTLFAVVLVSVLSSAAACSQSLREQYEHLTRQHDSSMEGWHARYDTANVDEDLIARYRDWPGWEFAPRFVDLAESAGADSVGFDCISRIVEMGNSVSEADQQLLPHYERSVQLLVRNHLDKDLRPVCGMVGLTEASESFLRTLVKQKTNRELRAEATLCLGRVLARKWLMALPDSWFRRPGKTAVAKYIDARCTPGLGSYLEGSDEAAVYGEAEKYLKVACEEFGDVAAIGRETTVGDLAKAELYELQHLSPGQKAPNIEAHDLLGKQMA